MIAVTGKRARALACLLVATLPLMTACSRQPSITFLEVPVASSGGIGSLGLIRGRVSGKFRGRHIFLYAFAGGRWWIQPFISAPRTDIAADGSWKAQIHLGTEYAALLSKEETLPAILVDLLPTAGKNIDAVAFVKASGRDTRTPDEPYGERVIRFSGFEWKVRSIPGDYGAKTNEYSTGNVSVDEAGALHLRLTRNAHGWVCSELQTVRSLGYGDYSLNVRDTGHLEPGVMFSSYTFFEQSADGDHREMAIHLTRRGIASNKNAEFRIQPAFIPSNFYHFEAPSGPLKLSLNWQPDEAGFSVSRALPSAEQPVASWMFRTGVPRSDDTHLYLNLCNYGYAPAPPTHNAEVIVNKFEFYP
jgi:hypothetical protein